MPPKHAVVQNGRAVYTRFPLSNGMPMENSLNISSIYLEVQMANDKVRGLDMDESTMAPVSWSQWIVLSIRERDAINIPAEF